MRITLEQWKLCIAVVVDEHCSKVALPTIAPREMSEALGGEEDGVLGPDAAGVSCGCAGDSASGRQCRE